MLCSLSAGTAEVMAAAAAAAATTAATGVWGERRVGAGTELAAVAPAAGAVAPRALLPVLASLPERCADIVGLALEVLETGQAAADALAREGGAAADGKTLFGSSDATGRWGLLVLDFVLIVALQAGRVALLCVRRGRCFFRAM